MSDWTFQTVFRPAFVALGVERGRRLALGGMGLLSRLPLGTRVIQLLGHSRPDDRLAIERNGLRFPAQIGLGCHFDPQLLATRALAEFGFGFLEIGPIQTRPAARAGPVSLDAAEQSFRLAPPQSALTPVAARERLVRAGPLALSVFARVEPLSPEEAREMVAILNARVAGYVTPIGCLDNMLAALADGDQADHKRPALFAAVDAEAWMDESRRNCCVQAAHDGQIRGVVVIAAAGDGAERQIGKAGFAEALETTRSARAALGEASIIIAAAGIHSPADALDYLSAGADLLQVDSGLFFAGPGLAKRINEALLYQGQETQPRPIDSAVARLGGESWFWALLMGLSMLLGGFMALLIAITRVVMPYDEAMSGLRWWLTIARRLAAC